jgi:hypothetical protein
LNLSPHKLTSGLFDKPSVFFSLDKNKHIIMSELNYFHWDLTSWKEFRKPFATPDKIEKDLFKTREVKFYPCPPIILNYGE